MNTLIVTTLLLFCTQVSFAFATPTLTCTKQAVRINTYSTISAITPKLADLPLAGVTIKTEKQSLSGSWNVISIPKKISSSSTQTSVQSSFARRGYYRTTLLWSFEGTSTAVQSNYAYQQAVGSKVVALTLDDGPSVHNTVEALQYLKQYRARATFFVLGRRLWNTDSQKLLKQIAQAQHQIGSHRYGHLMPSTRIPLSQFETEISTTNRLIKKYSGVTPTVYRHPWGQGSVATNALARKYGMRVVRWTYGPQDGGSHGPYSLSVTNLIANRVISNTRNGSVILMHDAVDRPNSVAALKKILPTLQSKGFDFVTIEGLLDLGYSVP